nr:MAG TPA: hypothetical protein [Bacteriophage sp.]
MADIRFDTGVVAFNLNDKIEVSFNPTDSAVVEKIYSTFEELDRKQEAYKAEIEKCADKKEIFEIARRRDAEMRDMIDGLFEKPVCAALFGAMNVYALADGLPVWCNLMLAVIDQIDTTFSREQKRTNPRIAKYTDRWKK